MIGRLAFRLSVITFALLSAITIVAVPASANLNTDVGVQVAYHRLRNVSHPARCLVARNGTDWTVRGVSCGTFADQRWAPVLRSENPAWWNYQNQVGSPARCMMKNPDSNNVMVNRCSAVDSTGQWVHDYVTSTQFRLRVRGTNSCLLLQSNVAETPARLTTCGSYRDQYWYFD
ncbi:RICIN domain-containing protein [Kibdelosporangium aridum]|uniref:RICIN domain-containing protein n=1 Tax=Kibdelosporangium aridum TaxID=2030 RepID=UPI0005263807